MTDQSRLEQAWTPWIAHVASAVGVDPAEVDADHLLEVAGLVSREVERPMAPVATYLLGLAAGDGSGRTPEQLRAALLTAVPPRHPAP